MITDKTKTPYAIYIQENMADKQYGINQDESIRGMVKYIRSDCFPTDSEMLEIAKNMTYFLDDRLCPYSREELRARAWLEGYNFAKKNWEYPCGVQEHIDGLLTEELEKSANEGSDSQKITLKDFIERFSHNNPVWIENKKSYTMYHKYREDQDRLYDTVMDWELKYTDIADCEVIKIKSVIRQKDREAFTIVVDTDKDCFNYIKEKVTLENAPLWLYEQVHDKRVCAAECSINEESI